MVGRGDFEQLNLEEVLFFAVFGPKRGRNATIGGHAPRGAVHELSAFFTLIIFAHGNWYRAANEGGFNTDAAQALGWGAAQRAMGGVRGYSRNSSFCIYLILVNELKVIYIYIYHTRKQNIENFLH